MELSIGKQKYKVKPYLIKKCGDTKNVAFRVYKDDELLIQFEDLYHFEMWFSSIVITETIDEEPEK